MKNDSKKENENLSFKELRRLDNAKSKDAKINKLQEMEDGVSVFPHDEETLKTFNFKEMNFKDMTNAQKNTFIIVIMLIILIVVLFMIPGVRKLFGNISIGDLRFLPKQEEEEKPKEDAFAFAGDYVIIGENTSITVEKIKFNNFTKSSDYKSLYNYTALEDINDVSNLNIYIEYYNYSRQLLKRIKFEVNGNILKKDDKGLIENQLSENSFNKAHYIRIRKMTESEIIEVPDPEDNPNYDPENPNTDPKNPNNPSGGSSTSNKNELNCTKVNVDSDLRINESMVVKFEKDAISEYSVEYKLTTLTFEQSKVFAKYYKKMLKKFKNLDKSGVDQISIFEDGFSAYLNYTVVYSEFNNADIDENWVQKDEEECDPEICESREDLYEKVNEDKPYKLEIKIGSSKEEAKEELQKEEWTCK